MRVKSLHDGPYGGGVYAVDPVWTGSGHSFFLWLIEAFFLPLAPASFGSNIDIAKCDVTRGGVIAYTLLRVWAHAWSRCVPARLISHGNSFPRFRSLRLLATRGLGYD